MDQDGVSVSVTMLLDVTSVSLSGDVVIGIARNPGVPESGVRGDEGGQFGAVPKDGGCARREKA